MIYKEVKRDGDAYDIMIYIDVIFMNFSTMTIMV